MEKNQRFLLVDETSLPEIFLKVIEAKNLIEFSQCETVQEAVQQVGISRSAFYKYKDCVFSFYENLRGRTITFGMNLMDKTGLLSSVLNLIASNGANVLTINQTIPINGVAHVTITIEMNESSNSKLFEILSEVKGVKSIKILARE